MTAIKRFLIIIFVLSRFRLDELIPPYEFPWYVKLALKLAPWRLAPKNHQPRGERLRQALEQLGPVFIKFGQLLSTRRDLLPDDIVEALAPLQDKVPPFDSKDAVALIEKSLEKPLHELFASFDHTPLASASIAQVHSATLHNGDNVVVKIIRPSIRLTINQDIALMEFMAKLMDKHVSDAKRLRPIEVVDEYKQTIFDELDLQHEAANATQLRRNFQDSDILYIPEVYWDLTRKNVMVMEKISGTPLTNLDDLTQSNINIKVLAERGVEIFFTQVFRDSFFHADMHPGNIFVSTETPDDPKYIAIDFGIMGTLTVEDQNYLAHNLLAFFNRDYHRVATLHIESGWVPSTTRAEELAGAIRTVCEPIFEKPIKEISFGHVLIRLFQTARRFNMQVQPQLILLQKTLVNIEGLGRQIYPDLDLWKTAKPFLEQRIKEKISPKQVFRTLASQAPFWLEQAPKVPQLLFDATTQIKRTELYHREQQQALSTIEQHLKQHQKSQHRWQISFLLVALSAFIAFLDTHFQPLFQTLALIGLGISIGLLMNR